MVAATTVLFIMSIINDNDYIKNKYNNGNDSASNYNEIDQVLVRMRTMKVAPIALMTALTVTTTT